MKEWKTYRIGDICKTNSSQYSIKEAWDEFLYLDTGNITRNTIDEIARYSSAAELPSRARRKVICDDIIFSTVRPNQCHFGILSNPPTNLLVSTGFTVITANKEVVDPYYLYYYLSQDSIIDYLHSIGEQAVSAYPSIKSQDIEDLEIELPDLATQNNIAKTLRALDNKIELNRKINDNLEQQLQTLYRKWFIENPKPEWPCISLSEIATFTGGYSYKGNELVDTSDTAMATIKNFERKGGFKIEGYKPIIPSSKLKEDQRAQLFDILVAHTDLTQNAEVIGNAEILLSKDVYENLIYSMDLVKVNAKDSFPFQFLLALLLKNGRFKSHCIGYVNGTTVLHMNKRALPDYETIIPLREDAIHINNAAKAIFHKMSENLTEVSNLTKMRDSLLPKLMSGELKINEIDC